MAPTDVSEVVNAARFNAYHGRILALCGALVLFDGFDLSAIGFAAPEFANQFAIKPAMIAPVFSAGLLGLTLGGIVCGPIADRIGARRVFAACGVIFGLLSLAIADATSVGELLIMRFIAGIAIGGASPIAIAIASDILPSRLRTTVTMVLSVSASLGAIAAGHAYGGLLTFFGWRGVFWIGGLLPLMLAPLILLLMPEPLEFLVMRGAPPAQIQAILARIEPRQDFSRQTQFTVPRENKAGFQPVLLFRDGRAAITVSLWVVFVVSLIAIYFLLQWLPTLLSADGLSSIEIVRVVNGLQLGGLFGVLFAALLVVRLPPFLVAAAGYFCAALAVLGLAAAEGSHLLLALIALSIGIFLLGAQSVLNVSSAGLYPCCMRSTGVGWGFGVGRAGATLSPAMTGTLVALQWRPAALFMTASVPAALAALFMLMVHHLIQRRRLRASPA
ncbi:MAG TPA: MFS transporter [Acetobacteraceae bacterium]|nr:MFS transporter [Acetobacteraceae bacterium]